MNSELEKTYIFKKENKFLVKSGCKKRLWRSLKQILTAERALPWPNETVLYYSVNAPPTFKPTKKYSDISGLPAPYMDRHSKLYYSNVEEFTTVRSLPMDITAGYLQLRGASAIVVLDLSPKRKLRARTCPGVPESPHICSAIAY